MMTYKEAKEIMIETLADISQHKTGEVLEAFSVAYKALDVVQEMADRNIQPEDIMHYMMFEDECVKKGFDFNSLLEAREKMAAKKVVREDDDEYSLDWCTCPTCHKSLDWFYNKPFKHCDNCGQKLDWSEEK